MESLEEYYYSEEEDDFIPSTGRASWLTPNLVDAQTNTPFAPPRIDLENDESVDFNQSVRSLGRVSGVERNIKGHVLAKEEAAEVVKTCNFVFLPGVLFGRKIVSK